LHGVDDSSGRVFLRFAENESTATVLSTMKQYCQINGIPNSIYTDKYSVYYSEGKKTEYQIAMEKLSVKMIYANSPEAKGRVERGNRTLQDRLVKEMRLRGISTIEEANEFLTGHFIEDYNRRFAKVEALADIHRETDGISLDDVFCYEIKRQVRNDCTITLKGNYIQLERSGAVLPIPGQYVTIRRYLEGSLHILNREEELEFTELKNKPDKRKVRYYPLKKIILGRDIELVKRDMQAGKRLVEFRQYEVTPVGLRPPSVTSCNLLTYNLTFLLCFTY
jgi:hypothetical protein